MPKNNVNDLITDQEMAFARLVLSGKMTDRQGAEAVGLNPESASYTKSKPRVRAWMMEHRAAVEQQLVEQDTQELRRFNLSRDQVLARLWDIANMEPERTRNSMSSQVKALSMIVAIEGLIPDRHSAQRAVSAQNMSAPPPDDPGFYTAAWLRARQNGESADPDSIHAQAPEDAQQEAATELQSAPGRADDPASPVSRPAPDPTPNLGEPTVTGLLDASQTTSSPHPPGFAWVPDSNGPFKIDKNRFGRRR
jgi:hypothetical protein